MILRLGEAGVIQIWVGRQVLRELEAVTRRKAPRAGGFLALLLDRCRVRVGDEPASLLLEESFALMGHAGDARVLAEAWATQVDYFVTLDKEHFLENDALRKAAPFAIGTPGDFLTWYRRQFYS